ncbi:PHP domain-containing protein [Alkalihalobacillus pseudalcaliphilus]|uniref:PHP domain-containing protein n=1 Tax=Alkalihalobacillus pseudalcaliphilus TaxID=79884 RepID=UPI000AE535E1|nr:PHP domain-containing protein [Alkalihalobacillus pseudalcaliphilus]
MENHADLHMHSTASDGGYSPTDLMEKCARVGLQYVALTDHDTIQGIEEAKTKAEELGLQFITGIELSTKYNGKAVHILGYGIRTDDASFVQMLTHQQRQRSIRLAQIIDKLKNIDVHLEEEDVLQFVDGGSVGRPHMAKALVEKGYVQSIQEAFDFYLAEGKPAYVEKEKEMTVAEAIRWIKQSQGISIVAHPGHYSFDSHIKDWVRMGLDGIEIYHRDHTSEQIAKFEKIKADIEEDLGISLYVTGGSDFHHEEYGRKIEPLGQTRVNNRLAEQLLKALNEE